MVISFLVHQDVVENMAWCVDLCVISRRDSYGGDCKADRLSRIEASQRRVYKPDRVVTAAWMESVRRIIIALVVELKGMPVRVRDYQGRENEAGVDNLWAHGHSEDISFIIDDLPASIVGLFVLPECLILDKGRTTLHLDLPQEPHAIEISEKLPRQVRVAEFTARIIHYSLCSLASIQRWSRLHKKRFGRSSLSLHKLYKTGTLNLEPLSSGFEKPALTSELIQIGRSFHFPPLDPPALPSTRNYDESGFSTVSNWGHAMQNANILEPYKPVCWPRVIARSFDELLFGDNDLGIRAHRNC
ncbi:hypothetical protein P153DRAFT_401687 [Dothidotthia symphoricarpi CBS 119687]|uniref:Uncharacterized protein n=1 Tax=Dothidotthia symphoricarpi CBS 119687 TaxID=1392245 RepID=A0A6A5ZW27_9PLEO|nr:uncharacterized protein P153DRAFT_401687 [Dothidotthia symphoricarpi CBS 119687]KAF2123790.1 hypothetical protein P153DRAFT_401687 [Dothidotthia symphoricarpi CBS 119687]